MTWTEHALLVLEVFAVVYSATFAIYYLWRK